LQLTFLEISESIFDRPIPDDFAYLICHHNL
jgi:hypothetical protein